MNETMEENVKDVNVAQDVKTEKNKKNKKIAIIIEICVCAVLLLGFIALIVIEVVAPTSTAGAWIQNNVWNTSEAGAKFMTHLPVLIKSVIYIVIVLVVCILLRLIFKKIMEKSHRAQTIITLIDGLVKYAAALAIIILILQAIGVNAMAIFASVGILTLVIGLGCQSLIADIVAGMFLVFENEYNVCEIITVGDFRGTVTEIGIRSTKILDAAGNIKIINNSDVSNVINNFNISSCI